MNVDGGVTFGTWDDSTSRLIYHDLTPAMFSGFTPQGTVVDLGGGNGLLREQFTHLVTVDVDEAKQPDVVADITTWRPDFPVAAAVCRYVTHYLTDGELFRLLHTVKTYTSTMALVAITTDPAVKVTHSHGEKKTWREIAVVRQQLAFSGWRVQQERSFTFDLDPDFYRNRLQHPNPQGHRETITGWHLESHVPH